MKRRPAAPLPLQDGANTVDLSAVRLHVFAACTIRIPGPLEVGPKRRSRPPGGRELSIPVPSGKGGRLYGKSTEDETSAPENGPAPARSGAIEERGAQFACCTKFSRIVPPRDGRIHRLVLL